MNVDLITSKAILLICDGMGDRPVAELRGKTPLEAASTPNFDELARTGCAGLMDPLGRGVVPGSDTANLAILGYNPCSFYTGRGPFEALGLGIPLSPGDVAFRCNFATTDSEGVVVDRRAGRYISEAGELAEALNRVRLEDAHGVKAHLYHGVEHRGVLVLKGSGLSAKVSNTDPHKVGEKWLECKPLEPTPEAQKTARAVNEFTRRAAQLLAGHPANLQRQSRKQPAANILLSRGAGERPAIPPLQEKYGLKGCCVAGIPLVKGVCSAVAMSVVNVPGATGGIDTDLDAKAKATCDSLARFDLAYLHVKATDAVSHDKAIEKKIEVIERIDSMVGKIQDRLTAFDSVQFMLTCDHATPVSVGEHTGDPVPILFTGPGLMADDVEAFTERAVRKGSLGRMVALDIMPTLANYMGKASKFGE